MITLQLLPLTACSSISASNKVECILLITLRDNTFEVKEIIPTYILLTPVRNFCTTADEPAQWLWGKSIDYFLRSITKHLDDCYVFVSPVYWVILAKSLYMHHYSLTSNISWATSLSTSVVT